MNRIIGYDIIKALSICLVVLIHYTFYSGLYPNTIMGNAVSVLSCVGVPLFFMVNGALLLNRPLNIEKHYKKTANMVITLLAWRAITPIASSLIINRGTITFSIVEYVNFLMGADIQDLPIGHFWFIYVLVGLYLLLPFFHAVFSSQDSKACLVFLGVGVVLVMGVDFISVGSSVIEVMQNYPKLDFLTFGRLFPFSDYSFSSVYFLAGGYIGKMMKEGGVTDVKSRALSALAFLVAYIVLFAIQRFQSDTLGIAFCVDRGYEKLPTLVMSCSVFVLACGIKLSENNLIAKLVAFLGSNTLGVYYLHVFPLFLLGTYVAPHVGLQSIAVNLCIVFAIVLMCSAIASIAKKIPLIQRLF